MGYQETYIRAENPKHFDKLVDVIQSLGQEKFWIAEPVELITLNQHIEGTLANQNHPEASYSFEKGERFVYVVGDRGSLRNSHEFFRQTGHMPKIVKETEIYFTECFPSEEIFRGNAAEREPFKW